MMPSAAVAAMGNFRSKIQSGGGMVDAVRKDSIIVGVEWKKPIRVLL